jgi:ParB family transcriptional regulator, chromosome partitioning protein
MAKRRQLYTRPDYTPEDIEARRRDIESLYNPNRIALQDIPVDRIRPNPFQARQTFENIDELADSIRQHGFITRLRLRPAPGEDTYFELVYGERRLQAAKAVGMAMVPCEIAYHTDDELIEIGLVENLQRDALDPLEEAEAFRRFIDHHNYSMPQLAERIGKTANYIEARLALLRVPADVREMVKQRPDTVRAARDIARLPPLRSASPSSKRCLTMNSTPKMSAVKQAL